MRIVEFELSQIIIQSVGDLIITSCIKCAPVHLFLSTISFVALVQRRVSGTLGFSDNRISLYKMRSLISKVNCFGWLKDDNNEDALYLWSSLVGPYWFCIARRGISGDLSTSRDVKKAFYEIRERCVDLCM